MEVLCSLLTTTVHDIYLRAHIILFQQPATGPVHRVTGYELNPLRVDLEASMEQPRLHLETDSDHGLHFNYPASILLLGEQVGTATMYVPRYAPVAGTL